MQSGPYIAARLMPKIVAEYCTREHISFQSFSDEWVLRLSKDDVIKWIVGYKFDINSSAAGELAQDKVATYAALNAASIDAVPHYLVRSSPKEMIHIEGLHQLLNGAPVVAKPLEGTGGREVEWFRTTDDALAMIKTSGEPAWALASHLDLQAEYRFVMLEGELLVAYEKTQPTYRGELKLFNLGYGAIAKDMPADTLSELLSIAECVINAMALRLAAVDIVKQADDSFLVLEVNDGISMEHYARQSDINKDRAADVYASIIKAMYH